MRSMKFKVGDRVRVTEAVREFLDGELYEPPPGTEGTIREAGKVGDVYGVELYDRLWHEYPDGRHLLSGYHEHELELVEEGE
jgi:hypothetical protein